MKQSLSQRKKSEPSEIYFNESERKALINKKGRHHMYFKRCIKKWQTRVNRRRLNKKSNINKEQEASNE